MAVRKKICFVCTVPMAAKAFLQAHINHLSNFYDVYLISNFAHECERVIPGASCISLPISRNVSIANDFSVLLKLRKIFKAQAFDAVHSITPKAGLLAMMAAYAAHIHVRVHCFTGQVWATRHGFPRIFYKYLDWFIAKLATKLFVDSPSQRDFLVSEGICKKTALFVIGDGSICGVDSKRFCPNELSLKTVRERFSIPLNAPLVLFLGRLNQEKGVREMAHAMLLLEPLFLQTHWLFVGPDEQNMSEYIRAMTGSFSDRVHFQGFTSEPELFMASADIFCLPSYREGFGSSVLEAAASGLPAVATQIYGLVDAVEDGITGILVEPRNHEALAMALKKLLEAPELRAKMGAAARHRAVNKFSSTRIVEGLSEFYSLTFGVTVEK